MPEPRRVSGRVVVFTFLVFAVTSGIAMSYLANKLRPETMAAAARAMPLSGTIHLGCREPGTSAAVDVRERGICSRKAKLELSLPSPGIGVKSLSYLLLSASPTENLIAGQFDPHGAAEVDLSRADAGTHMAVFVYADKPMALADLTAAVKKAPAGSPPEQVKALEQYCGALMHSDAHPEIRTARVEMKIVTD